MHSANHWGGSFDINGDSIAEDEDDRSRKFTGELDRAALHHRQHQDQQHPVPPSNLLLDETQQSWLLGPQDPNAKKKKYIDLGCIVCSRQAFKWTVGSIIVAFLVIGLPIIIVKTLPEPKLKVTPPDDYTVALKKSLLFFDAQMSGRLPKGHRVPWRGNSGLKDGSELTDVKGGLVGGYYDAGDNIKFHFPMAFSMSMLSWSVLEYSHKYKAIGEFDHVREIIKWGTDYLLLTFNSSATVIDKVYSQVGVGRNGTTTPDDHYCWQRPEDMDYDRPVQTATSAPDLAAEMASALASASIVFRDNLKYSQKLVKGAKALYDFARNADKRERYSRGNLDIEPFYNSTNYFDEHMWSAAWMYYATGNASYYLSLATNPGIPKNANAFKRIPDLSVLSWENKLPAAELLLTRLRIFLSLGYPYEDMLSSYYSQTGLNMCSYLRKFNVFNWTQGGMIQLNHGRPQPLQYVANAAFISSLFVDYMKAIGVPGWNCGPNYIDSKDLANFATSQVNYILGANPRKMSYLVGYGTKFPRHVHHRGASMPRNKKKYGCIDGRKWLKTANPNPINITGAMVGGPNKQDGFIDVRTNYNYTEPTLAGNAGLVAALVSLTSSGRDGIDKNTIFSAIPPLFPAAPPPPPPWKP